MDLPVNLQQLALCRRQCRKVSGENERSPTLRFTVPVSTYTELYPPSSTDLDRLQPGNAVSHGHRRRTAAMVLARRGTFSEEPHRRSAVGRTRPAGRRRRGTANFRLDSQNVSRRGYEWVAWKTTKGARPTNTDPVEILLRLDAVTVRREGRRLL